MRSFTISLPAESTDKVLVFLHGVGEAFIPTRPDQEGKLKLYSDDPGEVLKEPGLMNVFHHGLPKILHDPGPRTAHKPGGSPPDPPFSLPIFREFLLVIPQTFLREDMADLAKVNRMMDEAIGLAKSITRTPRVGLLGFSRGGYAAFHLARSRSDVKAIVTMDAAPLGRDLRAFEEALEAGLSQQPKPFWAFFADYKDSDPDFEKRITQVHRTRLRVPEVDLMKGLPGEDRCKTLLPTAGDRTTRHNQVCNVVSGSPVVYEWLSKRL